MAGRDRHRAKSRRQRIANMTHGPSIIDHYTHRQSSADDILRRASERASDPDYITIDDLCRFDEMHVGGYHATRHFIPHLEITEGMNVLDIGSGIGGPARYTAATFGAHVTGIDLTPTYKDIATALSYAVRLSQKTRFLTASACDLPFENGEFDAAYTMHVGMNIADKQSYYGEAARILKQGGIFGVYDTFLVEAETYPTYPLPWAEVKESSFLLTLDQLQDYLTKAGFEIIGTENRRAFAIETLTRMQEVSDEGLVAALDNLLVQIKHDTLCPHEVICKKA